MPKICMKAFTALTPLLLISNSGVMAVEYDDLSQATLQVTRVYYSLKNVNDDIGKSADASEIRRQVNFLLNNYKLKENLNSVLKEVPKGKVREEIRTHAVAAIEDLALVNEYYEDSVDNDTGKKSPVREVLIIAEKATNAAREEIQTVIQALPDGMGDLALRRIGEEFQ
jgi:hypothetical protein